MTDQPPQHPSQYRSRVKPWQQAVGLIGAPLAWMVQISIDFALSDLLCGRLPGLRMWTIGAGAASVLACAVSTWVAYGVWTATRSEAKGEGSDAIDVGEGRSRFFAITGMLAGAIFFAASVATLLSAILVSPC